MGSITDGSFSECPPAITGVAKRLQLVDHIASSQNTSQGTLHSGSRDSPPIQVFGSINQQPSLSKQSNRIRPRQPSIDENEAELYRLANNLGNANPVLNRTFHNSPSNRSQTAPLSQISDEGETASMYRLATSIVNPAPDVTRPSTQDQTTPCSQNTQKSPSFSLADVNASPPLVTRFTSYSNSSGSHFRLNTSRRHSQGSTPYSTGRPRNNFFNLSGISGPNLNLRVIKTSSDSIAENSPQVHQNTNLPVPPAMNRTLSTHSEEHNRQPRVGNFQANQRQNPVAGVAEAVANQRDQPNRRPYLRRHSRNRNIELSNELLEKFNRHFYEIFDLDPE